MRKISTLATQHEGNITEGLDDGQRGTLRELLATLACQRGLTPHVHPGYRTLGHTDEGVTPAG
jgi:hypothetical protein